VKKLVQLAAISVLIYSSVLASGFQLNEQGARAMAMGGAFAGLANDPSALYFNPAGITQLKGTNFYLGGTLIMPLGSYKAPGSKDVTAEQVAQTYTPVNFYVTHAFSDDFSIGLSINNQYGLGTKWDENWSGRYLAVNTQVKTFQGTFAVAYKILDNLSISAGAVYGLADVTIEKKNAYPLNMGKDFLISLDGDGGALGFTAGLLYKPFDNLQFGLSYRSEISYDLEGTSTSDPASVTFTHPVYNVPVTLAFPNGDIKAPLTTPQNITFGLAYMANKNLTLTADFQYVGWSSYDKLEVTFASYDLDANSANGMQNVQSTIRDYKDTYIVRAGLEYTVSDAFTLRGGVLYDHNPVKDELVEPTLPDADRIGLNLGYGAKIGNLGIDVGYFFLIFADREVNKSTFGLNGTYSMTAHLLGMNLSYSL
jgi:long-chain fatty acid transport protein